MSLYRYVPGVGRVRACCTEPDKTETFISAFSTSNQILDGPAVIAHQSVASYNRITLLPLNSEFQVIENGYYKVLYSIQYTGTAGTGKIAVWLVKNGVPIPDTATYTGFKNGDSGVISAEFIVELSYSNKLQIYASITAGQARIDHIPEVLDLSGNVVIPAAPGIATDIYRIA